jgi:hypothetical protein
MKDILETVPLEFDRSAFLIDLVKHSNGSLYIEITQTIYNDNKDGQTIKINPSVLTEIIKVLKDYNEKIQKQFGNSKSITSELDKERIKAYY